MDLLNSVQTTYRVMLLFCAYCSVLQMILHLVLPTSFSFCRHICSIRPAMYLHLHSSLYAFLHINPLVLFTHLQTYPTLLIAPCSSYSSERCRWCILNLARVVAVIIGLGTVWDRHIFPYHVSFRCDVEDLEESWYHVGDLCTCHLFEILKQGDFLTLSMLFFPLSLALYRPVMWLLGIIHSGIYILLQILGVPSIFFQLFRLLLSSWRTIAYTGVCSFWIRLELLSCVWGEER